MAMTETDNPRPGSHDLPRPADAMLHDAEQRIIELERRLSEAQRERDAFRDQAVELRVERDKNGELCDAAQERWRQSHEALVKWRDLAQKLIGIDATDSPWLRAQLDSRWNAQCALVENLLTALRDVRSRVSWRQCPDGNGEHHIPTETLRGIEQVVDAALAAAKEGK